MERLEGPSLNIRVLQEYIAFARVLNFSAAAREMFMAQSTLSVHLQKLEESVGVKLINHGPKPTLTPSGRTFLDYAEQIVCLYLDAIAATRASVGKSLSLVIEEPQNSGPIFELIMQAFNHFNDECPSARLTLRQISGKTPVRALLDGVVEVAKVIDDNPWESEEFKAKCAKAGIDAIPLAKEMPVVWMQENNPLAEKEQLSIHDLNSVPLLVPADVRYDDWRHLLQKWFIKESTKPLINLQVTETLTEFFMANLDGRVFMLPESLTTPRNIMEARRIVARPISDDSCAYYVSLAYLADNDNPLLEHFIEFISSV